MYIIKDEEFIDDFVVLDDDNIPVTGLIQSNFTEKLFDPSDTEVANISGGVPVTIVEVGNGVYRASFTPTEFGNWFLVVYNSTYFPFGKGGSFIAVESLGGVSTEIEDMIRRILGLSQENLRTFEEQYDNKLNLISTKIKIYPSATDVDNDTNATAEYLMTATWDRKRRLTGYKYKRTA